MIDGIESRLRTTILNSLPSNCPRCIGSAPYPLKQSSISIILSVLIASLEIRGAEHVCSVIAFLSLMPAYEMSDGRIRSLDAMASMAL